MSVDSCWYFVFGVDVGPVWLVSSMVLIHNRLYHGYGLIYRTCNPIYCSACSFLFVCYLKPPSCLPSLTCLPHTFTECTLVSLFYQNSLKKIRLFGLGFGFHRCSNFIFYLFPQNASAPQMMVTIKLTSFAFNLYDGYCMKMVSVLVLIRFNVNRGKSCSSSTGKIMP